MSRQQPPPKKKKPRQPRTRIDDMIGQPLYQRRIEHNWEGSWEVRPIAERMLTIDGELHDSVKDELEELDSPDITSTRKRDLNNRIAKAVMAVEGMGRAKSKPKGATTVSQLYAYCRATGLDIGQALELAGVSKRKRTIEDAIVTDSRLNERGKDSLCAHLETLLEDPEMTKKPSGLDRKRRKPRPKPGTSESSDVQPTPAG